MSEISILGKIIPGAKNFTKVLKKRFMPSESLFESFATAGDIYENHKWSWFEAIIDEKENMLYQTQNTCCVCN